MSRGAVLVFLLPAGLIILAVLIAALFTARRKAVEATRDGVTIPPSRRPGPDDQSLEGPLLERYQLYGLLLTLFLTLFLPFLLINEPNRQRAAAAEQVVKSEQRGHATYEQFCARCHGVDATGGVVKRFKPPNAGPDAEPIDYPVPNLRDLGKRNPDKDIAQIAWETIQQGRPGTPMPAWGVRHGGPMNDQQVTDLVNFLLSIQSDGKERPPLEFKALGPAGGGASSSEGAIR